MVGRDLRNVGKTPLSLDLEREATLLIKKKGYWNKRVHASPKKTRIDVKMTQKRKIHKPAPERPAIRIDDNDESEIIID